MSVIGHGGRAIPEGDNSVIDSTRLLSDQQRICLRLVGEGYESKEIGQQLGLSYNTVNQHIARAMRTLGVTDRRHAARMLATAEEGGNQWLVNQPSALAEQAQPTDLSIPQRGWRRWLGPLGWLVPVYRGATNDLDLGRRTILLFILPLAIIMVTVGALASFETLARIIQEFAH